MSNDGYEIAPAQVPLSHKEPASTRTFGGRSEPASRNWRRPLLLATLAAIAVALLWWVSNRTPMPNDSPVTQAPAVDSPDAAAPGGTSSSKLPPFAQSQLELARERAQSALAKFVEQQIELEEQMAVGDWGQEAFEQALAIATEGDELFVDERFEPAQESYDQATKLLADVIAVGNQQVIEAVAAGQAALLARDDDRALAAFETALAIDSDNTDALAGQERARKLPQVKSLALKARNHELAGQWQQAVADYQAILALDPETAGINDAMAKAQQAVGGDLLRTTLSGGFRALEQGKYSSARTAFNKALQLSPGNEIALGGLQQVSDRTEISRIDQLQRQAQNAVANEDWNAAVTAFEAALALDPNIQFAKAGLRGAKQQQQVAAVLADIVADPNKLSSAALLEQGNTQLSLARSLQPNGPKLQTLIAQSAQLLTAYAKPVTVQLTSDNQTEILVSSVGKLGRFANHELSLRPGEYVLLGSRSGCRDVRRKVIVAPGMTPVDIRCEDRLGQ